MGGVQYHLFDWIAIISSILDLPNQYEPQNFIMFFAILQGTSEAVAATKEKVREQSKESERSREIGKGIKGVWEKEKGCLEATQCQI